MVQNTTPIWAFQYIINSFATIIQLLYLERQRLVVSFLLLLLCSFKQSIYFLFYIFLQVCLFIFLSPPFLSIYGEQRKGCGLHTCHIYTFGEAQFMSFFFFLCETRKLSTSDEPCVMIIGPTITLYFRYILISWCYIVPIIYNIYHFEHMYKPSILYCFLFCMNISIKKYQIF